TFGETNSQPVDLVVFQTEIGIFNTGVSSAGTALADNLADPHYVLIASPDTNYPGPSTFAANGLPSPPWIANDDNSRWITPRQNAAEVAPGAYRYRLIFSIDDTNEVS